MGSRKVSDADGIYKGRQLYVRIYAFYMFDVKNHAPMYLDDLHTVKCHNHDTRKCLRDWDFVWARLDPNIRKVLTGKVEVELSLIHI